MTGITGGSPCPVRIFKNMVLLASFTQNGSRGYGKVGDVDNDGLNELVIATPNGDTTTYLKVYKHSGGGAFSEVWNSGFATRVESRGLSIGDMDTDGVNEIILAQSYYTRKVDAYRHVSGNTYNLVWTDNNGSDNHSSCVGDVDNDGQKELVVGSGNGNWDTRVYENGALGWSSGAVDNQQAVIGDVDNDGQNEILVVSGASNNSNDGAGIYKWNGTTYQLIWYKLTGTPSSTLAEKVLWYFHGTTPASDDVFV